MNFKTEKGIEIRIDQIKGKDYMPVAQRLLWFRSEHPDWSIETTPLDLSPDTSFFKAEIKDEKGRVISTGHKREHKVHFSDHEEKSETGSIGRALAHCGYGTQFAPELEESHRIVDSPQEKKKPIPSDSATAYFESLPEGDLAFDEIPESEDGIIDFGAHRGKKFSEIIKNKGYMLWVKDSALKPGINKKTSAGLIALFEYAEKMGVYK